MHHWEKIELKFVSAQSWEAWNRTKIAAFKGRSPTVRRSPSFRNKQILMNRNRSQIIFCGFKDLCPVTYQSLLTLYATPSRAVALRPFVWVPTQTSPSANLPIFSKHYRNILHITLFFIFCHPV